MCQVPSGGQVCFLRSKSDGISSPSTLSKLGRRQCPPGWRGSCRHCQDGCWHGSSQEPGFGEQAGITAGPPPYGEEPPDRARTHVLDKALGAELGLSKEGGLGSEIHGISAAPGPSLCPAWGGTPLPELPTVGWGSWSPMHGVSSPCHPSQVAGAEAVGQCPPWVTPHIHPTGTKHHRGPTPYPRDTQNRGGPQHTAQHTSSRHHAGNSTSRQHDRGSTDKPGPPQQVDVRPRVWPQGGDTHGAHSYLPSLSPCHVFSRACPVEAMSEVECGVGGQHGTGHRGTGGRDITSS